MSHLISSQNIAELLVPCPKGRPVAGPVLRLFYSLDLPAYKNEFTLKILFFYKGRGVTVEALKLCIN